MYRLEEKVISAPEGIGCKYFVPNPKQTDKIIILIVSVIGEYPYGSKGNDHARYISIKALAGLKAFDPECVILDLREMKYQWGNSLLGVFQDISQYMDAENEQGEPNFPMLAVTSEKSRSGFLSLVTPANGMAPEWHFDDIYKAIEFGIKAGREWLDY